MKTIGVFSVICGFGLLAGAAALFAQEPPPPPAGGKAMFFSRIEERSASKLVKGAPYSAQAITETTRTLADGNQIDHKNTATLYRDSQGRTRREATLGDLGPWSAAQTAPRQIVFINDPVAGVNYVLHPDEHVARKMPPLQVKPGMNGESGAVASPTAPSGQHKTNTFFFTEEAGGALPPPPPSEDGADVVIVTRPALGGEAGLVVAGGGETIVAQNEVLQDAKGHAGTTEKLGTQTIEGVEATGTRTTFTIPAGQIGNEQPIQVVTERWYAPSLQAVVMSKRSDPRVGVTTYRLTNISLAEPSPDLFQVPADYTVKGEPGMFEFKSNTKPSGDQ